MQLDKIQPPRTFRPAGPDGPEISHVATVTLSADEQVTFRTADGAEVDFVRKDWGFYPLPSLNVRLPSFELYPVLVSNREGSLYLLLVQQGKRKEFEEYVAQENLTTVAWIGPVRPE